MARRVEFPGLPHPAASVPAHRGVGARPLPDYTQRDSESAAGREARDCLKLAAAGGPPVSLGLLEAAVDRRVEPDAAGADGLAGGGGLRKGGRPG